MRMYSHPISPGRRSTPLNTYMGASTGVTQVGGQQGGLCIFSRVSRSPPLLSGICRSLSVEGFRRLLFLASHDVEPLCTHDEFSPHS